MRMTLCLPTELGLAHAYSVRQFGQLFNIGRSSIYEEIRCGRLKIRKVGKRTLITHQDAMDWLTALPRRR